MTKDPALDGFPDVEPGPWPNQAHRTMRGDRRPYSYEPLQIQTLKTPAEVQLGTLDGVEAMMSDGISVTIDPAMPRNELRFVVDGKVALTVRFRAARVASRGEE